MVVKERTVMQRMKVSEEAAVIRYEALLIDVIVLVDRVSLSRDEKSTRVVL